MPIYILLLLLIYSHAYPNQQKELLNSKWKIQCSFKETFCAEIDAIWEFTNKEIYVTKLHRNSKAVKEKRHKIMGLELKKPGLIYFLENDGKHLKNYKIEGNSLSICDSECRVFTKHNPK